MSCPRTLTPLMPLITMFIEAIQWLSSLVQIPATPSTLVPWTMIQLIHSLPSHIWLDKTLWLVARAISRLVAYAVTTMFLLLVFKQRTIVTLHYHQRALFGPVRQLLSCIGVLSSLHFLRQHRVDPGPYLMESALMSQPLLLPSALRILSISYRICCIATHHQTPSFPNTLLKSLPLSLRINTIHNHPRFNRPTNCLHSRKRAHPIKDTDAGLGVWMHKPCPYHVSSDVPRHCWDMQSGKRPSSPTQVKVPGWRYNLKPHARPPFPTKKKD